MPKYLVKWITGVIAVVILLAVGEAATCEYKQVKGIPAEDCVANEAKTLAIMLGLLSTLLGLGADPNER